MTTETVRVELGARSYDILIGAGETARAGARIAEITGGRPPVIVTDANVAAIHLPGLRASLAGAGLSDVPAIVLPAGEGTKTFAHLERLCEDVLALGVERSTVLIALGGGVIGDITGFAASILLRGLDFIQIPTTLLSQVDSSVGGKTGINTAWGKNLVGAFHQPRLVVVDTGTLDTLPKREVLAGYAEVVKYGLIRDPAFFDELATGEAERLIAGEPEARRRAVAVSCRIKAEIVGADERENADRALLNLGHTFGHAFEAAMGYDGRVLHGEAVAVGTILALDLSVRLGLCPADDPARVRAHFRAVGLPTTPGDLSNAEWDVDELLGHMTRDKKVKDGRITFILTRGVGTAHTQRGVDPARVRAVVADAVAGRV